MTNPGLSIGASGVGLPWHNHEAAWEAVVHGRKLFLLLPPMLARPGPPVEELYLPPTLAFIRGPFRRWRRCRKGHCQSCGYDLQGNVSGVCPECGKETGSIEAVE